MKKLTKENIEILRFSNPVKCRLKIVSDMIGFHLDVPYNFSPFTLDLLAQKIEASKLNDVSPVKHEGQM